MIFLPRWINVKLDCLIGGHVIDDEMLERYGHPYCHNCGLDIYAIQAGTFDYPSLNLRGWWYSLRYWFAPDRWFINLTRRWRCPWCDRWKTKNHDCIPF